MKIYYLKNKIVFKNRNIKMLSVKYISNHLNKIEYDDVKTKINNSKYEKLQEFEIKKNIELPKNILENKEEKIIILNKDYESLPCSFESYFDNKYCIYNIKNKNKSNIFTFFSSLFIIGDEEYILFNQDEKLNCIKSFIKKMDDNLFIENHYEKFGYTKNKYFNKEKILNVLKEAFHFRVNEYFNLLIQHVANYLGVHIFIFEIKNNKIESKLLFQCNKYTFKEDSEKDKLNYYLPNFFMIKEEDIYYPILKRNITKTNYLNQDELKNQPIFEKIKSFSIQLYSNSQKNTIQYNKMKLDELQQFALKNNILTTKISEKTGKEIKKKKDELIEDLKNA